MNIPNGAYHLDTLMRAGFIGRSQGGALGAGLHGEEGGFFNDKLREVSGTVSTMPKTYEQSGLGDAAVAHLHYFLAGFDWYITERDMEPEQHQAHGLAIFQHVGPDGGELGYISLYEITSLGAELDLHFTPTNLGEIRRRLR